MPGTIAQGFSQVVTVNTSTRIGLNSSVGSKAYIEATSGVPGSSVKQKLATHDGGFAVYGPFGVGTVTIFAASGSVFYDENEPIEGDNNRAPVVVDPATGILYANNLPVSVAGNGRGLRTVLLGDSLAAFNNLALSISTITLSAGVITVVTSSSHGLRTGQRANISGTSNSSFHVRNTQVTWISSTSFSYVAPASATGTATGGVVLAQNQLNACGDFVHTNARLGGRMRFIANLGVGGQTSEEILARIQEAFDLVPDVLWFNAGTNDVIQDRAYASTVADIEAVVSRATARGILVVIKTLPPFASGGAFYSAARNANLLNINQFIRRLASRYRGVYVLDAYRELIQPTDTNGYGATAYYQASDSVHYNQRGAARIGAAGATLLTNVIPPVDNRVSSITDNYGSNTANRDLWDRAPWINTAGGTANSPATGSVPTDFVIDSSVAGNWTVVPTASISARSDGLGFNCVVTATPNAAGANFTIRASGTVQNARLPSFVGQKYRWVVEVTVTNAVAAGLRSLQVTSSMSGGGATGFIANAFSGLNQTGLLALDSDAATTLLFTSPEFEIPSSPASSIWNVIATLDAASASAITVSVGSVRMQPMDDQ